jgi:beta-lactamase regulating signal transducer with metallopeptidase domain
MDHWIALLNRAGDSWASWMLHMSWQVALLAVLVWLVCRALHYSAARFRHLLWLTVFLKLVLPPMLGTPWSAGTLLSLAQAPQIQIVETAPITYEGDATAVDQTMPSESTTPESIAPNVTAPVTAAAAPTPELPPVIAGIALTRRAQAMLGWALMGLLFGIGIAVQYRRFIRRLLKSAAIAPDGVQEHVRARAAEWGVRKPILVMLSSVIDTPTVFGVGRPVILLPANWEGSFTQEELANILAHEVAHVKRWDLLITGFAGVLTCVYWFHPAVWIANLYQRREREMACDDLVLESNREAGKAYAATLLRVAEHFTGRVPAFAGFLGLIELSDSLLHRVLSATDARRPRRLGWKTALVLVAIVAMLPMGTWTATAQNEATPQVSSDQAVDTEIQQSYSKASPEIQEYIRWTARTFGGNGLWLPENAFEKLTAEEREQKIVYCVDALSGEYGRHLCEALAAAGVLKDKRLIPGVMKAATYHRDEGDYDCRPKWIAVEAAGRLGDESVVPQLIRLVDHGNQNTRMWARASLVRLTGQNFNDDKQAWGKWWNDSGKEPKIDLAQLKPWTQPAGVEAAPASNTPPPGSEAIEAEITAHYAKASTEVVDFVRWTASNFGRRGLWLPENAFESLTPEQREEKVKACLEVLDGDYGRQQCEPLAAAGVLKDKRLLPGVLKAATYHLEGQDYDCRTKWIAVEAAGRFDDESVVPSLVPLVDHGNKNVRLWARASLVRLTGQNFDADKQAWGKWWNDSGKEPKIDLTQLKPWVPPAGAAAPSPEQAPPVVGQATVPSEAQAVVDALPGELTFKATYHHRSRGGDLPIPSTLWVKKSADKGIVAATYMPSPMNTTYVAHVGETGGVAQYDLFIQGREGAPASKQLMKLTPGKAEVTYEGGEKNGQTETFAVPEANQFQPNSRPDPYVGHMALALQGLPMKDVELACYDWDNSGKGMAAYNSRVEYKGKEDVSVPAGVFNAQHYVETQTSFGDTWFKKRPGHVTEYWALDNGVMVRIFRHREPYEVMLASVDSPEKLPGYVGKAPETPAASSTQQPQVEPNIVSITPAFNATEVDPAITELSIVFDQDMAGGFSWTGGGEQFPKTTGKPSWKDKRTCVMPVQLEAGKLYRVGINSKSHQNFRSEAGVPVAPRVLVFTTKGADPSLVASLQPPKVAKCEPENGAKGVSAALDKITVTFDQAMGGGFSWTGGGDDYPEGTGSPSWSEDKKTCTLPVKLKPNWTYHIGLNSPHHNNFQSANGVPLEPVAYSFSTGN